MYTISLNIFISRLKRLYGVRKALNVARVTTPYAIRTQEVDLMLTARAQIKCLYFDNIHNGLQCMNKNKTIGLNIFNRICQGH